MATSAGRRRRTAGTAIPPGAWHVAETVWGEGQRVRLITGPPSLVTDMIHVRSIHAVGYVTRQTRSREPIGLSLTEPTVLLVQNKDETWTFPGGRLEGSETLSQALDREIWEEARARLTPGTRPIAATRIEFLNRVPGRIYRVHPTFLSWAVATVQELSDEPHHDPADGVIGRRVVTIGEAATLLGPLELVVLQAAQTVWKARPPTEWSRAAE